MAMWTDQHDAAAPDRPAAAKPVSAPTAAERRRADLQIRRRALCNHGGYTGTDPITGLVLCAICRRAGQHTPTHPDTRTGATP